MTHSQTLDAPSSVGIMDRLKTETRANHDQAEQNGFGVKVMNGGLTEDLYVQHLIAWRRMLAHLEHALRTSEHPLVAGTWHEGLAKQPVLDRDLDQLSPGGSPLRPSVAMAVQAFNDMVDSYAEEAPECLLGVLYVLEGSTMGGSVMKPRIAKQLGLEDDRGLGYYGCYGHQVAVRFKEFRARMGGCVDGSGTEESIIEAARRTFDRVGDVLRAITDD
ncbi:MAG: biliverdin-producing heme oxygenase [Planctomycetota bacterium]|nr:biliverdin-producing heme oxygenase [Planctomycetota bacterium]